MPYPLTETGKLARQYGLSYETTRYRQKNGIPLDAPKQPNGNTKAWQTRKSVAKPKPAPWKKALRRARNPLACMAR